MESSEDAVPARSSNPRVTQACQRCRTLKTRCLPSERAGTCQRCFTAKRDCVWAEVPRRPRRARGPSRISQVEQKIDGLVASLAIPGSTEASGANRAARTERPTAPGSWLPFPESFEQQKLTQNEDDDVEADVDAADSAQDQEYLEKLRSIHSFQDQEDATAPPKTSASKQRKPEPAIEDQKVKDLLSSGQAEDLLNIYRAMCLTFPFVPMDDVASATQLHATKPMLFLAIMTAASWDNHRLQMHLDKVYRKELAHYTFISPRRTISLLQSVLVYLSRYHFVFSHKTQQIYFMQSTSNGLALDLGLHQNCPRPLVDFPGRPAPPEVSVADELERQRTFLGCYYLSSLVAVGMLRPNLLKYTDYMGQCWQNLREHRQYPSDEIIGQLLSMRRLEDQIKSCFFEGEAADLDITDPRISMNFRFLEGQFDEWKREKYNEKYQILFDLSSAFADMQLHSIALRAPPTSNQIYAFDETRFKALLATLEACKRYLDTLLAYPVSEYHILAFSEWFRIPMVVITLARLCIPSDAHTAAQWDTKAAHERGRLDLYLDSLCYRMKALSTYKRTQNLHPDFYWAMEMIMDMTKTWFMKKIQTKKIALVLASTGLPTPDTGSSFAIGATEGLVEGALEDGFGMHGNSENDPFAFMRSAEFDMDKFFDAGLWGDETYLGMGFGGGMRY